MTIIEISLNFVIVAHVENHIVICICLRDRFIQVILELLKILVHGLISWIISSFKF